MGKATSTVLDNWTADKTEVERWLGHAVLLQCCVDDWERLYSYNAALMTGRRCTATVLGSWVSNATVLHC